MTVTAETTSVAALAAVTLASLVVNALVGSGISRVSDENPTDLTPDDRAFGIWFLIYTLIVVGVVYQVREPSPHAVNILLAVSLALATAWVPTFARESLRAAALLLVLSAASALTAIALAGPWDAFDAHAALVRVGHSLYAGWVVVATAINLAIATGLPRSPPPIVPFLLVAADVAFAVAIVDPVVLLPLGWAVVHQVRLSARLRASLAATLVMGEAGVVARLVLRAMH